MILFFSYLTYLTRRSLDRGPEISTLLTPGHIFKSSWASEVLDSRLAIWLPKKIKYWGLTCIGIFWEQIISSKKGSPAISKSKNLKTRKRSDGKQRLENFRIVQHANSGCYDSEHQVTDSVSFILIVTGRSVFGAFVFFFSQIFRFWVCVWLSCLW